MEHPYINYCWIHFQYIY